MRPADRALIHKEVNVAAMCRTGRPDYFRRLRNEPIRGKHMRISKSLMIAAGLVALAACNKKSPEDNQASAIEANGENQAENITATSNNEASAVMNNAENEASAIKNEGENKAAAVKNAAENKAEAVKNSASNATENKTK